MKKGSDTHNKIFIFSHLICEFAQGIWGLQFKRQKRRFSVRGAWNVNMLTHYDSLIYDHNTMPTITSRGKLMPIHIMPCRIIMILILGSFDVAPHTFLPLSFWLNSFFAAVTCGTDLSPHWPSKIPSVITCHGLTCIISKQIYTIYSTLINFHPIKEWRHRKYYIRTPPSYFSVLASSVTIEFHRI